MIECVVSITKVMTSCPIMHVCLSICLIDWSCILLTVTPTLGGDYVKEYFVVKPKLVISIDLLDILWFNISLPVQRY